MVPLLIGIIGAAGEAKELVRANNITATSSSTSTATASAEFNGAVVGGNGWAGPNDNSNPSSSDFEWLLDGSQGDYSVRFTQDSGDAADDGDALNTWHNLSSIVRISLENSDLGTKSASGTYEIRRDASGGILASSSWSLEAEVTV